MLYLICLAHLQYEHTALASHPQGLFPWVVFQEAESEQFHHMIQQVLRFHDVPRVSASETHIHNVKSTLSFRDDAATNYSTNETKS